MYITKTKMTILEILDRMNDWISLGDLINTANGQLIKGTTYICLAQLVQQGFVREREETENELHPRSTLVQRRRLYFITEKGREVLKKNDESVLVPSPNKIFYPL